jgi:predicted  nucleic acid-binding Zn-ribbon protein
MKVVLYLIAILVILTGSWFSFSTMGKFSSLQDDRVELESQNLTRNAYIIKTKKEAKDMEAERDQVKESLVEAEAELDNVEAKIKLGKRESSSWNSKIAEQDRKLKQTQEVIANVKKAFEELGGDVDLSQVPALVEQLENDVKKANRDFEEQQILAESADKKLSSNQQQIAELNDRIQKRKSRIAANKVEGRITAADHNWGFAVIDVPDNMPVDEASKLIVKRGAHFIGKVSINAIEGKRVIADIDYRSMKPGMVVQAGDAVILAKPVTN